MVPTYLAIFLKIVSHHEAIEPVVIGLVITQETKNTLDIIKGGRRRPYQRFYVGIVLFYLAWSHRVVYYSRIFYDQCCKHRFKICEMR